MTRILAAAFAVLLALESEARFLGFGIDAFNRVIPASASATAVFSPLSFEIDSVLFAEAADPIRRSIYSNALHVQDELSAEYAGLARAPFELSVSNRFNFAWAHAFVFEEPRRFAPTFRVTVQDAYGAEVCRSRPAYGIEAWVRARFGGRFDGWRLPELPRGSYAYHDLVALDCRFAPSNAVKRAFPSMTVYRAPLVGGCDFYALVPKTGRSLASIRPRLTSASLDEILSFAAAVTDPPVPVRVAIPPFTVTTTNDLTGAFTYFHFPTSALKPFPIGAPAATLRQTMRFRLEGDAPAPEAEQIGGDFIFFIHDPALKAMPVAGVRRAEQQ